MAALFSVLHVVSMPTLKIDASTDGFDASRMLFLSRSVTSVGVEVQPFLEMDAHF